MAECKTALRGDEVICLTHNQRYAGCVLDERDRLKAEVERLNERVKVAELQIYEILKGLQDISTSRAWEVHGKCKALIHRYEIRKTREMCICGGVGIAERGKKCYLHGPGTANPIWCANCQKYKPEKCQSH